MINATGKLGLGTAWLPAGADGVGIVAAAIEGGIDYIDTAPSYGNHGSSESSIGIAAPGRTSCVVATKVGPDLHTRKGWRPLVIDSIHQSRRRLAADCLDVVQIHELTNDCWRAVFDKRGVLQTLLQLQADGVIARIGLTGSSPEIVAAGLREYSFDSVLVWKTADLIDDTSLQVLAPVIRRCGTELVVGTPLSGGALARARGDARVAQGYLWRTDEAVFRRRLRDLIDLANQYRIDLGAIALQFLTRQPLISAVIPGPASLRELAAVLQWVACDVPEAVWADVAAIKAKWRADR